MKTKTPSSLALVLSILAASGGVATAQQGFWAGGGSDGLWTNTNNWTGSVPGNTTGGVSGGGWAFFQTNVNASRPVIIDNNRTITGFSIYQETGSPQTPGSFTFNGETADAVVYFANTGGIQQKTTPDLGNVYTFNINIGLMAPTGATHEVVFSSTASGNRIVVNGNIAAANSSVAMNLRLSGTAGTDEGEENYLNGAISDGTGPGLRLVKQNGGHWVLAGANSYRGGTSLEGGVLHLNHSTALGTGKVTISGGSLSNSSGGAITLTNNNTIGFLANGTLTYQGTNDLNLGTGDVDLGETGALAARVFSVTSGQGALTVGGVISDGSNETTNQIQKTGVGRLVLSNANTFTGGVNATQGVLDIRHAQALGTGELRVSSNNTPQIDNGSGAGLAVGNTVVLDTNLRFVGTNDLTLSGTVYLGGSVNIYQNTINVQAGTLTLAEEVRNGRQTAWTPTENATKAGDGALVYAGDVLYTGATRITAGALLVDGNHLTGTGYAVDAGATIGGAGLIRTTGNQSITFQVGARLSPGSDAGHALTLDLGTGTLNLSNLVSGVQSGNLLFTLGGVTTSDRLVIGNAATTLTIGNGILDLNDFSFTLADGFGAGDYTLFSTLGGITGSLGSELAGVINGHEVTLGFDESGRNLMLSVQVIPEPGTVGLLAMSALGLGWMRLRARRRSA